MKSADVVEWGKPLQMRVRETPLPQGREVLVRVRYCGVCHSDVHVQEGYFDMGGGNRARFEDRGLRPPLTMGHEPLGTVVATGPDVDEVRAGQSFVVYPWTGCGRCRFCASGEDNLCASPAYLGIGRPGGFATHMIVPDPRYLVDYAGVEPATAATLACSGITAYAAVRKLDPIHPDDWVAVVGCGGLGLTAISLLKGRGHGKVLACDVGEGKLEAARARSADAVLNLADGKGAAAILARCGSLYGLIDFVGAAATASLALPTLRPGGRAVIVGLFGGALPVALPLFGMREISLMGSKVGTLQDLRDVVALARAGKLVPAPVTVRPLEQAEASLRDLEAGRVTGRIVLDAGAATG